MKRKPIEVVAAILCVDQKILVGRRKAGDSNAGRWEFPGGKVESKESSEEALQREILEELGFSLAHFTLFETVFHEYQNYSVNIRFYISDVGKKIQIKPLSHDELKWISPNEGKDMDFLEANKPVLEKLSLFFGLNQ